MPVEFQFDMAPVAASSFAVTGVSDIGEVFDGLIDAFDNAADFLGSAVKTSKVLTEFSKTVQEIGTATSAFIPQTRAVRIFGKVLLGLKIGKLLIGEDEGGGGFKQIGIIDIDELVEIDPALEPRKIFYALANAENLMRSRAGATLLDPVWLADPKA